MAIRLGLPHRQVLRGYLPSIKSVLKHVRTFSSQDEFSDTETNQPFFVDEPDITQVIWPDPNLGPLGISDPRFPLPGHVGVLTESTDTVPLFGHTSLSYTSPHHPMVTLPAQPGERHFAVFAQYLAKDFQNTKEETVEEEIMPKAEDKLECSAHDCPHILRKDFADLFPDRNTLEGAFTVITLSQQSQHDMTAWSVEMEAERETLLENFMQGAMEICNVFSKNGFWADFIDPSNGKPFKGAYTNSSLFETDERYRKLGFHIDDLGCCKVIRHPVWGTHAFISCMFTDAPPNHPLIMQLVNAKGQT